MKSELNKYQKSTLWACGIFYVAWLVLKRAYGGGGGFFVYNPLWARMGSIEITLIMAVLTGLLVMTLSGPQKEISARFYTARVWIQRNRLLILSPFIALGALLLAGALVLWLENWNPLHVKPSGKATTGLVGRRMKDGTFIPRTPHGENAKSEKSLVVSTPGRKMVE